MVQVAEEAVAVARDREDRPAIDSSSTSSRPSQNAGIDIAAMKTSLIAWSAQPPRRTAEQQRERHRQRDRDHGAEADQRQASAQSRSSISAPTARRVGDRQAEAAGHDVAEEAEVLLPERPVEAELARQRGDVLGIAARAQHQGRRVARHDPQQQERHRGDADQHRDQLQQPARAGTRRNPQTARGGRPRRPHATGRTSRQVVVRGRQQLEAADVLAVREGQRLAIEEDVRRAVMDRCSISWNCSPRSCPRGCGAPARRAR